MTHKQTNKQIYRRTQTLNPPLRIGAPGNYTGADSWLEAKQTIEPRYHGIECASRFAYFDKSCWL